MYMLPDLLTISCRMNGADAAIHIGVTQANVRGGGGMTQKVTK